jgi:AraC-like DNA-binding protein
MDFADKLRDDDNGPLVFTRAGTVTLHDTAPHSHARGQLIGCERGVMTVETETGAWVVPARHAIWLPPHHRHGGRTHGTVRGWSLYVAKPACVTLPAGTCTLAISPLLWEAALRSSEWGLTPLDESSSHVAHVIIDEIQRAEPQPLGLALPRDERVLRVARALLDNPGDERGLEAWAAWAGVSARTLGRRFVAETSLTFTAWTQRARLLRGLEMLAAGMQVTTIAIELGYRSVSAFIALFKRTFGVTPSTYFERR